MAIKLIPIKVNLRVVDGIPEITVLERTNPFSFNFLTKEFGLEKGNEIKMLLKRFESNGLDTVIIKLKYDDLYLSRVEEDDIEYDEIPSDTMCPGCGKYMYPILRESTIHFNNSIYSCKYCRISFSGVYCMNCEDEKLTVLDKYFRINGVDFD